MTKRIYLSSPHMSEQGYEMKYVKEAFNTNWIGPLGENINQFQVEFAKKLNVKAAAAVSTGTAAIHLSLKAANVREGDIVFCQSLTFAATANPIIYQGATPVFIDSDFETWNMCPKALEQAFEKYPNVKAVVIVHLYGIPAAMDEIKRLCDLYDVKLIEDAAESLGSYYKGIHTGTIGDYGIFSFNGNKIITASSGGMLVSNDENILEKVKFWATQAKDPARHYEHSELGYNYRMDNVVAGIGRGQLLILEERVEKKKYIFNYYKKHLQDIKEIAFMPELEYNDMNYWLSSILLDGSIKPIDLLLKLEENNIESRPLWKPMHLQPYYMDFDFIGEGVSEQLFKNGLCLPSDTNMNDEDLDKVIQVIKGMWN